MTKTMIIGFDGSRAFINKFVNSQASLINKFVSSAFKRSFQASLIEPRTGTEEYSFQLLKALSKIDRENKYIVYVRPAYNVDTIVQQLYQLPKNFELKVINWPRFWTQGGLSIQTFKDNLDVLFVPAHTLPLIRKRGLKTVVTVHDLGSEYLPSMHQFKQRLYLSIMQKYQLKTATKIIAVSKATKMDLVKKVGIDPDKVAVVYEGYDKNLFKPIKKEILRNILKQFDIESGEYFLFVGTVQPRKNLERLIRAFVNVAARSVAKKRSATHSTNSLASLGARQLKNKNSKHIVGGAVDSPHFLTDSNFTTPYLVIAGSRGWLSDEIYKLPKKLGIEDSVKFLDYVQNEHLPALYSGAIALTFPSLFEGFGLPILEAQACGCPVITSNVSSMPEVAGKGAVLVNPYFVDDIVKGMEAVMSKELRIKLIKQGFENIKRFSWEKCARETLAVFA